VLFYTLTNSRAMCYNNTHGDTEREEKQIVYNYMLHIKTDLYKRPQNEIHLPSADTFIRDDKEEIYGVLYYIMGLEMRVSLKVVHSNGTFIVSLSVPIFLKKRPFTRFSLTKTFQLILTTHMTMRRRSQWARGLRRSYAAARLLRSWVRISPGAWKFVCCGCCVLSGRSFCE
jgi:hypothetical protein